MNNVVDLHTLSHQIHRENILNLKSHFFVQFRYKMFLINAIHKAIKANKKQKFSSKSNFKEFENEHHFNKKSFILSFDLFIKNSMEDHLACAIICLLHWAGNKHLNLINLNPLFLNSSIALETQSYMQKSSFSQELDYALNIFLCKSESLHEKIRNTIICLLIISSLLSGEIFSKQLLLINTQLVTRLIKFFD